MTAEPMAVMAFLWAMLAALIMQMMAVLLEQNGAAAWATAAAWTWTSAFGGAAVGFALLALTAKQ